MDNTPIIPGTANRGLGGVLERIALVCASVLLLGLGLVCLIQNAYMPLDSEMAQLRFNGLSFYLLLAAVLALTLALHRLIARIPARPLFWVLAAVTAGFGLFLILHADTVLRDDAAYVYACANTLNSGNFFSLLPGGYLFLYPHQLGLVTYERLLMRLCSGTRFLFCVNLGMVLVIDLLTWKTAALLLKKNRAAVNYTILFSFLFFPQLFFVLFLYGLIPGFCALCAALYFLVRYFDRGRWADFILTLLMTVLACILRSNFSIAAIAIAIVLILRSLRQKRARDAILAVLFLALVMLSGKAVPALYARASGTQASDGIPKLLWLTMGLQDKPDSERPGGWYNEYTIDVFSENGYDGALASQQAASDLTKRLTYMGSNPLYTLRFFFQKLESTWCEPTFQSIWSGPLALYHQTVETPLLESIYSGGALYDGLNLVGSVFLCLLYFLSGAYGLTVVLKKCPCESAVLFSFIFFLGGLLFHLAWETKSQYVYPYVFLLIPAAAQELTSLCDGVLRRIRGGNSPKNLLPADDCADGKRS